MIPERLSRRDLFRTAGFLGLGRLLFSRRLSAEVPPAASAAQLEAGPGIYRSIGVRPLINCRGTLTVIGGSIELPEVRKAKDLANRQHCQLDELMEAVGRRLAELTGAEWGMVSAGCAAAMSHATAACVAGGNPDLHVRIPNLTGFHKDEVVIPTNSRNSYIPAIQAVGVHMIEVDTLDDLRLAIGPKTAMVYFLANSRNETGPMSLEAISKIAEAQDIPVLVDAAAEALTIPNIHLQRGATLVCYSGGKIIRGPQSAGLLLGRKDLVRAAWVHSAPHHGYARSMKVGREEIVGMLAAVESWVSRDHDAEWREWIARCDHIADRVSRIHGVTTLVWRERRGRSTRSPRLTIRWDAKTLGITGPEVAEILDTTDPRIQVGGGDRQGDSASGDTGISLNVSMMAPGDEQIVAARLSDVLSAKRPPRAPTKARPPAGDLTGQWKVDIQFAASKSTHRLAFVQHGNRLQGVHYGDFRAREVAGVIDGDNVAFASGETVNHAHGINLSFSFSGTLSGDSMSGSLDMGEYLTATWTARRHVYGEPL